MIHAIEKCSKSTQILNFDNVPSNETLEIYPSFPRVFFLKFSKELIGDPSILFERNLFSNITILSLWNVFFTAIKERRLDNSWISSPGNRKEFISVEDDSEKASWKIAQILKKIVEKCPKLISLSFGQKASSLGKQRNEALISLRMETVKLPKKVKWLNVGWNMSPIILDMRECELLLGAQFRRGKRLLPPPPLFFVCFVRIHESM